MTSVPPLPPRTLRVIRALRRVLIAKERLRRAEASYERALTKAAQ